MKSPYVWTKVLGFVAAALVSTLAVSAAQPTEASVKELLELSGAAQAGTMMKAQLSNFENGAIQQALKGHELTPAIQKILEENSENTGQLLKASLDWTKIEPVFVKVYQASLTQEEVDGIVAFYKTPAGKAMVQKTPVIMQQSTMRLQQSLGGLAGQLQQLQKDTILRLQAEFVKQG